MNETTFTIIVLIAAGIFTALLWFMLGDEREIPEFRRRFDCPACHGTGMLYAGDYYDPPEYCGICDGTGTISPIHRVKYTRRGW